MHTRILRLPNNGYWRHAGLRALPAVQLSSFLILCSCRGAKQRISADTASSENRWLMSGRLVCYGITFMALITYCPTPGG